jgi:hypothetical protein
MKKKLAFLIIVMIFSFCKKSDNQAKYSYGYVVSSSGVPFYENPKFNSKITNTLKVNTKLSILEDTIEDKERKNFFWLKVKDDQTIGYISRYEVDHNKSVSLFKEISYTQEEMVKATSLRLRKSPSLNGEIVINLKKSERVTIIAEGSANESIDGFYDNWVKVRTSTGLVGYCFNGFLSPIPDVMDGKNLEAFIGNIEIQKGAKFYKIPGSELVDEKFDIGYTVNNKLYSLKEGDIIPADFTAEFNGTTYYLIDRYGTFKMPGGSENIRAYGWISYKDIKTVTNKLKYTFEKYGFSHPEIIDAINSKKPNLDVRDISVKVFGEKLDFYLVEFHLSNPFNNQPMITEIYQKNENGQISFMQTLPDNEFWGESVEFIDFDGDGVLELHLTHHHRNSSTEYFYAFNNGKYEEKLKLAQGEYWEGTEGSDQINLKIEGDTIEKFKGEKLVEKYKFSNNQFVKI